MSFRYRQSNGRQLLPASDYYRSLMFRCLNCAQRIHYHAFGSNRKPERAAEHLIDGSEKRICRVVQSLTLRSLKCFGFARKSASLAFSQSCIYDSRPL